MFSIHSPVLKGKSGIMHTSDVLVDKNRKDPYSGLFERNLALDIWLPTDQPIQLVRYDKRALNFWRKAEFWTADQKKILDDELCKLGQYSVLEKSISLEFDSLPVVIFLHGFGAWASFYSYIIEEIVSHNIAVIGINHTYQAGIAEFPQQTIYGRMSHSDLFQSRYADREQSLMIQDLENVIEKIKIDSFPYTVMNSQKIVVMGQSLGGSTAVQACTKMPNLRGCINLDGAVFGKELSLKTLSPLLLLLGGESIVSMQIDDALDRLAKRLGITIEQANDFRECYLTRLDNLSQNNQTVEKIILEGVDHIGFTDFAFLKKSPLFKDVPIGSREGDRIIDDIRKYVTDFLQKVF